MRLSELPIVDAHHHLWNVQDNYIPWLCDEPLIPFRYGDYRPIRRNYLAADFRRDHASLNLVGSVYIETEWDPTDPVGETRWLHELAEVEGVPDAMVAQAHLDADNIADVLAAQAQFPLVRGVRHKPVVAADHDAIVPGTPGSMSDPVWRRGFALLDQHRLSFDLQAPWWHFAEAAALAADFPDTRIIINHTGLPADRSAAGIDGWRAMMQRMADEPNVALKISGLGLPGQAWTVEANGPIVREAIRIFGVDRCMFASNFPVDSLVAGYTEIFEGFSEITQDFDDTDRAKLFATNAQWFYRL